MTIDQFNSKWKKYGYDESLGALLERDVIKTNTNHSKELEEKYDLKYSNYKRTKFNKRFINEYNLSNELALDLIDIHRAHNELNLPDTINYILAHSNKLTEYLVDDSIPVKFDWGMDFQNIIMHTLSTLKEKVNNQSQTNIKKTKQPTR